ncbi:SDR family NAD(P)-dependent oxidoreductase [Aquisediminimonas profunda]|uniref:SDR family NAD(P)-dependent oxidoreductase n=1 Tax=Aquisediminimonas profunda TaxID=1550733 RepID=UPI001C63A659|nr:SDR family oxidoreductase [Aquisediminimonas profunda]
MSTEVLAGQTAFVTGGYGAIASASATLLARDGAAVLLMGRRKDALERARAAILAEVSDARVELFVGDAVQDSDVGAAIKAAYAIADRLDIVVATVGGVDFRPFEAMEAQHLRDNFDYNVTSAFHAMHHAVPLMKDGGSIVCISSTEAARPTFPFASYHVSKSALEALVRAAAEELGAKSIRVNAVRPGLTRSGATEDAMLIPEVIEIYQREVVLPRFGEPVDIANAVRYLAGPEASWVTGQSFAVDGGIGLHRHPFLAETPLLAAAMSQG